jgi:sec-independent protein translocase protein TatA
MFEGLLSPMHLLIIAVIALIVLGPKRLPEAGRGLGEAIRGFRESINPPSHDDEVPDLRGPEPSRRDDERRP